MMMTARAICLSLGLFVCGVCRTQTITQAFNEPSVGDVDKNYSLDTSAYTNGLPLKNAGTGLVWDFTRLQGAFPVLFDSIVSPVGTPGASSFPGATYVQKRGNILAYFRSSASPSKTEWLGAYSPSLTVTFTNSAIIATYPIAYGYSMTDTVVGTFKYGSTNGVCNGALYVMADATGTLNLPGDTSFKNVLRLRSVEHLTLSVGPLPVGSIDQYIHAFYVPGKKFPLLTVQYQKYQLLAGTPTITAQAYGNFSYFTVESMDEYGSANVHLFPNPCKELVHIRTDPAFDLRTVRVTDLQGRLLIETTAEKQIRTGRLSPGVYLLQLTTPSGTLFRKLVRE